MGYNYKIEYKSDPTNKVADIQFKKNNDNRYIIHEYTNNRIKSRSSQPYS